MTYSVLVCEDEIETARERVSQIKATVPEEYKVLPVPTNSQMCESIKELLRRRKLSRAGNPWTPDGCLFDGLDILVVDYDLLHIDEDNAQYTGEGIARLARTFSTCYVVIILNQYPGLQFDLSLRGHLMSHGDLNIDSGLIGTPSLWRDPPWEEFRPWSWQTLSKAVETQKARVAFVEKKLNQSIFEAFGMEAEDVFHLSDTGFGFVAPDARDYMVFQNQTFKSFLENTIDGRDANSVVKRDSESLRPAAQFVGARIGKWLEREVLGPQDVLIDIPHLIQFYPFLLDADVKEIDTWNNAIHNKVALENAVPDYCWFKPDGFLSRPVIWRRRLEKNIDFVTRRAEFDYAPVPEIVFLEDVSVFAPLSETTGFRAGFHNSFDRRYVKVVDGVTYSPQRRFAVGI